MISLGLLLMATATFLLVIIVLGALFVGGIYLARQGDKGQVNAGRRSFLKGRASQNEGEYAIFFGLQLVIQVFGGDELRAKLARLVQNEDDTDTAQEKRRFMKSVAALLTENQYAWEYGFWDYYTDAETAISTFNQWRNEIEASMATEPDEMGQEVDRLHRFSDQKEYLIVTLMFMLDSRDEPVTDESAITISARPTRNSPRSSATWSRALMKLPTGRPRPSRNCLRPSAQLTRASSNATAFTFIPAPNKTASPRST